MRIAVYPASFDPFTNGHLDIAQRAATLFDKLYVAVYDTPAKNIMFSTQERVALVRDAIAGIPNAEATAFQGLTVDYAKSVGANAIVRGLRAIADFEWEFQMALMNRKLAPDIQVVCLMAGIDYQFLSSTLVKEVAKLGGDISSFVPPNVAEALERKIRDHTEPPPVPRYLST